ncbi:MAG: response regulator, partial [Limisphaerales bacterium]
MGLAALVNTEPDMEVIAEAADGAQAIDLFAKCNPDVALMDSRMPVKNGIEATIEIHKRCYTARILMLTAFDG